MLLIEALRTMDCPICLVRLEVHTRLNGSSSSPLTNSAPTSTAFGSSDNGFRITYAPGVSPPPTAPLGCEEVVVLRCGHFFHALCVAQLYECSKNPCCPVCRAPIYQLEVDAIKFEPRTRPMQIASSPTMRTDGAEDSTCCASPRTATATPTVVGADRGQKRVRSPSPEVLGVGTPGTEPVTMKSSERGENATADVPAFSSSNSQDGDDEADDILIVGARTVPLPEVYREQLGRMVAMQKHRRDTIRARAQHLESSLQQLQEDCTQLTAAVATAENRYKVLTHLGGADRLLELRRVAVETKTACDECTHELAVVTRSHAEVKQQIEKYTRKLNRLPRGATAHAVT